MPANEQQRSSPAAISKRFDDQQTTDDAPGPDDNERAWATDQNDDSATARSDPSDEAIFRDREATRLVDPAAEELADASTDTESDVGTTFPREAVEGPWEPFEADRPYFPPTDPVVLSMAM